MSTSRKSSGNHHSTRCRRLHSLQGTYGISQEHRDQPPANPALRVSSLVMVDADGREVAFLDISGGIPRLLLKGEEKACCIITPDGLVSTRTMSR